MVREQIWRLGGAWPIRRRKFAWLHCVRGRICRRPTCMPERHRFLQTRRATMRLISVCI